MAIRDRVNQVLADWCGEPIDDQTTILSELWTATRDNPHRPHDGIDFQPDGVNDLLAKLRTEFRKPGKVRKDTSVLTAVSFKPTGTIDLIDDLVDAVVTCPNLPPTAETDV
jgi:hypothetical protein